MDAKTFIHVIERMIHRYRHRWGIENGFTKQKHFVVRTTSTERDHRFFNVAFACVYEPRVDANQLLTVAKQWYGLDPPE